jgi:hypothetical protein
MAETHMNDTQTTSSSEPFAVMGWFETPAKLYHACEKLRDAGFQMDAHTPFPVHGLEKAMGVPASPLPWIVLGGAFFGGTGAFTLQWWVHAVEYPQNISGKPFFAYQAYIPVTFELTVLLSAFATFFGLWGLCKLPQLFHPTMQHPSFDRASDDRFFVSLEVKQPGFDMQKAKTMLAELGAHEVAEVAA